MAKRLMLYQVDSSNDKEREEVDVDEGARCGFCGIKWGLSSSRGDWIKGQIC
jgi:hypothetical protein